jgi:hypothetical protein
VVFVAVRNHNPAYALLVLDQVGKVGDDDVYAEHLLAGEFHPSIDDENLATVLEHSAVLTDATEASQWQQFQFWFSHVFYGILPFR